MNLVQGMYQNVRRCVRVGEDLSDEFEGKVGVHQGCVLRPQHRAWCFVTVDGKV